MRIVFWQNCLSPHQLPYITCLVNNKGISEVVIAVGESISKERKEMGWDISNYPNLDKIDIYINPNIETTTKILEKEPQNSYHLFSGIRGFVFVYQVFRHSLSYPIKRGIITERPNTFAFGLPNGKPIWLHKLRFFIQDRKYIPYIDSIFAIGEEAVTYYQSISKKWRIIPFAYCTKDNQFTTTRRHNEQKVKFIFIGGLSWWKAVDSILYATKHLKNNNTFSITIIGKGKEKNKLQQYCNKYHLNNVHFIGTKPNIEIPSILQEHDILILPSIYDGWGAVINEALMQGKYVICSDKCGAKALLNNPMNGSVFESGNNKELANQIQFCINNIAIIRSQESQRKKWANECISGKAIAKYMIYSFHGRPIKAPWIE